MIHIIIFVVVVLSILFWVSIVKDRGYRNLMDQKVASIEQTCWDIKSQLQSSIKELSEKTKLMTVVSLDTTELKPGQLLCFHLDCTNMDLETFRGCEKSLVEGGKVLQEKYGTEFIIWPFRGEKNNRLEPVSLTDDMFDDDVVKRFLMGAD